MPLHTQLTKERRRPALHAQLLDFSHPPSRAVETVDCQPRTVEQRRTKFVLPSGGGSSRTRCGLHDAGGIRRHNPENEFEDGGEVDVPQSERVGGKGVFVKTAARASDARLAQVCSRPVQTGRELNSQRPRRAAVQQRRTRLFTIIPAPRALALAGYTSLPQGRQLMPR